MVSFLPTFPVLFMSLVLCLNILIFPSLLYCCKRFTCRRSLDVSDLISNMIPLRRIDTLAWQPLQTEHLVCPYLLCLYIYRRDGEGFPLRPSSSHLRRQVPRGTVWPTQAPDRKASTASSVSILLYCNSVHDLIRQSPAPLKVLDSIEQYRSNQLPLIEKIPTP